jgi:antirestriction protein ArdC
MTKSADRTAKALATVVDPIIAAIEEGVASPDGWIAPWHRAEGEAFAPYCPATGKHYTAGNRFLLGIISMFFGASSHWGTYRQWKGMSKHTKECNAAASNVGKRNEKRPACGDDCHIVNVRKGETSVAYAFRPILKKFENEDGTDRLAPVGFSPFAVFHSGQVDGYEVPAERITDEVADADAVAAAFEFAALVGAEVSESDWSGASYSPVTDSIRMPDRGRWKTAEGAWGTMLHELTHWTGHESRLNRDLSGRFGSESYAVEELVAELGAAFLMASLGKGGSEPRPDHAHYLAHWLKVLKEDPKHLLSIASHAEKASGFVLDAAEAATSVETAVAA